MNLTGVQRLLDIATDIFAHGVITAESARVQLNWWPQSDEPD